MTNSSAFRDPAELAGILGVSIPDDLLVQALTHRSFAYEHGGTHYERLEFLGDAILQQAITLELFERFRDLPEGELSTRRAALVSTIALAEVARSIGLGAFLRLGNGEIATGGHDKSSLLADVVESLIGATFLSHGQPAAMELVIRLVGPLFDQADRFGMSMDHKTALQEHCDRHAMGKPVYEVNGDGPDHARTFHATVSSDGVVVGAGSGSSKKAAEASAAMSALAKFAG
jgi:ribonuclease-3